MAELQKQTGIKFGLEIAVDVFFYLLKRWYLLILAGAAGAIYGYYRMHQIKPVYTATYTFVLSTDPKGGNGGLAGLAAQLGVDGLTSSPDNIFAGDNIIELFKSRKLVGAALLSVADTSTQQSLLNYIAERKFTRVYKRLGPFGNNPALFNPAQTMLYRNIISRVAGSFMVFKKDKKLIFYIINANDTDPNIAYYTAKIVLDATSKYFIDTKTKVSANSVKLLQHEADSLGTILSNTFSSTASMNDRTYNLNPSITIQRSGSIFNQAKAAAFSGAYTEVMRNLEIAKINLQRETPLYRIIDEPELPLVAVSPNKLRYIIYISVASLFLMIALLVALRFKKDILSKLK
jgi:hypothetical protein